MLCTEKRGRGFFSIVDLQTVALAHMLVADFIAKVKAGKAGTKRVVKRDAAGRFLPKVATV